MTSCMQMRVRQTNEQYGLEMRARGDQSYEEQLTSEIKKGWKVQERERIRTELKKGNREKRREAVAMLG